jgi:hypothetical protein
MNSRTVRRLSSVVPPRSLLCLWPGDVDAAILVEILNAPFAVAVAIFVDCQFTKTRIGSRRVVETIAVLQARELARILGSDDFPKRPWLVRTRWSPMDGELDQQSEAASAKPMAKRNKRSEKTGGT